MRLPAADQASRCAPPALPDLFQTLLRTYIGLLEVLLLSIWGLSLSVEFPHLGSRAPLGAPPPSSWDRPPLVECLHTLTQAPSAATPIHPWAPSLLVGFFRAQSQAPLRAPVAFPVLPLVAKVCCLLSVAFHYDQTPLCQA